MIIGAYPTANYDDKNKPIADIGEPFCFKTTASGQKLEKMLDEIFQGNFDWKNNSWITNLVKVYLFKIGVMENRSKFKEYARKSINCLYDELSIANPKLIITLGEEVLEILEEVDPSYRKLDGVMEQGMKKYSIDVPIDEFERYPKKITLNGKIYNIKALRHPGFFLNDDDQNKKKD